MVVSGYKAQTVFNPGDIVYACAYTLHRDRNSSGKLFLQKPIKGMLTVYNNESSYTKYGNTGSIRYFVPFKKNGKGLAWSKAVEIYSRYFSDNYDECKDTYNSFVQKEIEHYEEMIKTIKSDFI